MLWTRASCSRECWIWRSWPCSRRRTAMAMTCIRRRRDVPGGERRALLVRHRRRGARPRLPHRRRRAALGGRRHSSACREGRGPVRSGASRLPTTRSRSAANTTTRAVLLARWNPLRTVAAPGWRRVPPCARLPVRNHLDRSGVRGGRAQRNGRVAGRRRHVDADRRRGLRRGAHRAGRDLLGGGPRRARGPPGGQPARAPTRRSTSSRPSVRATLNRSGLRVDPVRATRISCEASRMEPG